MRPSHLDPLFAPITTLAGIGPKAERLFARLLGREPAEARVLDLLFHWPSGSVDRRERPMIRDVVPGGVVTLTVTVDHHRAPPPGRSRAPYQVYASDGTGDVILTFFHAKRDYLEKLLPVGERRIVSGATGLYDGTLQMVHPDRVVAEAEAHTLPAVEPVYPLTEGLTVNQVRKAMEAALGKLPAVPEWQDEAFVAQQHWSDFVAAMQRLHRPQDPADIAPDGPAWSRLAFDELLASQLALGLVRADERRRPGRGSSAEGRLRAAVIKTLPYTLTPSQTLAVNDIVTDLALPQRMVRLVQGDVGSGKTVVALLAAATVVEAGRQAALMAPTEILARQHFATMAPLAQTAGIRIALLTGRDRGRERAALLERIASGEIDLVVGTHALFQDDVVFNDLALAIVDEQHRFGVHQRLALARKGEAVDMLVLTATPIPRTLVLTFFGDMEVSELREKPAGRQPIATRTIALSRLDEVVEAIGRAVENGKRVYWVCPLVEESESSDLAAAAARFDDLRQTFGEAVDLVHGQMKSADKDAAMARFSRGDSQILVATTVIEVGVDVPEATVIVIEHAERFGLAQLHQLRGRVGRGAGASTCLLLYRAPLGETAKARLAILRETEDGFRIAEEDLKLRGEGDLLGTRQSGTPGFRVARIEVHGHLLPAARDDAALILSRDPSLGGDRGRALIDLLYLFERDAAIRLIQAG